MLLSFRRMTRATAQVWWHLGVMWFAISGSWVALTSLSCPRKGVQAGHGRSQTAHVLPTASQTSLTVLERFAMPARPMAAVIPILWAVLN